MRIPDEAVIPREKLTRYLLVPRPWDDKSKFLARGGFALDRPEELEDSIRQLTASSEATEDGDNEYGRFLRVVGNFSARADHRCRSY